MSEEKITLTRDQRVAFTKLKAWLAGYDSFFVLRGYPGTGKTFLTRKLQDHKKEHYRRGPMIFCAPTNQAAKQLALRVGVAKTIYSVLGITMQPNEDELVLTWPTELPLLQRDTVIVLDEASMANTQLVAYCREIALELRVRFILVGDPAQLNPVGESTSEVFSTGFVEPKNLATMREIVRFDSGLLTLSQRLRKSRKTKTLIEENDNEVHTLDDEDAFLDLIAKNCEDFLSGKAKAAAWRNQTVDDLNSFIRAKLKFFTRYAVGELLIVSKPVEVDGRIVLTIGDHLRVSNVTDVALKGVNCYGITCGTHFLCVAKNQTEVSSRLGVLAQVAKGASSGARKAAWKEFWDFKKSFHDVSYGYAGTVHKLQGSTVVDVYVDQRDILSNRDVEESMRCLYTAATRPTDNLYTYL